MASIFMYHAVGNEQQIHGADPHYAVSEQTFCEHIDNIPTSVPLAHQILDSVESSADNKRIVNSCITFDDGHLSNYSVAFPLLKEKKLTAEFYVNTSMVGENDFMTWEQLKEMSNAGMSIQSHGHTHQYFSDMNEDEINYELKTSKSLLEKYLGKEVIVFAPPGGRTDQRVSRIARKLGYRCIATSKPGLIPVISRFELPRFAIIKNTSSSQIIDWHKRFSLASIKEVLRYNLFRMAKLFLGNQRYDRLRMKLLGEGQ